MPAPEANEAQDLISISVSVTVPVSLCGITKRQTDPANAGLSFSQLRHPVGCASSSWTARASHKVQQAPPYYLRVTNAILWHAGVRETACSLLQYIHREGVTLHHLYVLQICWHAVFIVF